MLIVAQNKKFGRHILASSPIKKGQLIEVSNLIIIKSKADVVAVENSILSNYVYAYGRHGVAIALGIGSLFNHSPKPNVEYAVRNKKMHFWATRNIKEGEQLFIDYGYTP